MKPTLAALAVAGCVAAVWVVPAGATDECRGLQVCVPVAGPWVVVPTRQTTPRPHVEYQLSCPRGYVVGGLDAELSSRSIDIAFNGALGSPVNPGITTARSVVFVGTHVGDRSSVATFRPHIGCMPAGGGGGRRLNSVEAFAPGHPATRRVSFVPVTVGSQQLVRTCQAGERLISATHAIGFFTFKSPGVRLVSTVTASHEVRQGLVFVTVHGSAALGFNQAVVQLALVCAGGR